MGWLPNIYHSTSEGTFRHRFANRRPQFQNRYVLCGKILIQQFQLGWGRVGRREAHRLWKKEIGQSGGTQCSRGATGFVQILFNV